MADTYEFPTSDAHPAPASPPSPRFQIVVGFVMLAALLITSVVVGRLEAKPAAPAPAPASIPPAAADGPPSSSPDAKASPAPEAPGSDGKAAAPSLVDEGLKEEVAALAKRFDALEGKLEAPDLKPLEAKVDVLAKILSTVIPLSEKIDRLTGRVNDLSNQAGGIQDEVKALGKEIGSIAASRAPNAGGNTIAGGDGGGADTTMSEAIDQFKKGHYKDALERFRKLADTGSKDARVLYYAALASGLSTSNWTGGDALAFVKKGVEQEKAGSPSPDKIDAVFSDLTPQTGKDWLAAYRKSIK